MDQKRIAAVIFLKLKEWVMLNDYASFQPLQMTVHGAPGTEKSTLINTITSVLRKAFQCTDVCQVITHTPSSAGNVYGETYKDFLGKF